MLPFQDSKYPIKSCLNRTVWSRCSNLQISFGVIGKFFVHHRVVLFQDVWNTSMERGGVGFTRLPHVYAWFETRLWRVEGWRFTRLPHCACSCIVYFNIYRDLINCSSYQLQHFISFHLSCTHYIHKNLLCLFSVLFWSPDLDTVCIHGHFMPI